VNNFQEGFLLVHLLLNQRIYI